MVTWDGSRGGHKNRKTDQTDRIKPNRTEKGRILTKPKKSTMDLNRTEELHLCCGCACGCCDFTISRPGLELHLYCGCACGCCDFTISRPGLVFHFFFYFDLTAVTVAAQIFNPELHLCCGCACGCCDFTISRPGLGTHNTNPIKSRHNHLHCRRLLCEGFWKNGCIIFFARILSLCVFL
ncbi:hypothetical protein PRUPE_6G275000 [Prunus persica]|uniref:Uncharacterized protein n=1 Tax=Prunus persica TaxID=3760 RepID=A0A251NWN8_PRUPE|nr:hypothetical protein PRUPE_6G275000 [Prunus persica]